MRILVDTREQRPLQFVKDEILTDVTPAGLKVGDYVAEYKDGSQCPIVFERKSLPDLFGTLTGGYRRFRSELLLAKQLNTKLILAVEGTLSDILGGVEYSEVSGETILRKLMTLWLKYDLVPMFFRDRAEMARGIKEFYEAFGRNYKLKTKRSINVSRNI